MSSSEKIAIAAHLHVLLRRKTGRVTDTEWMACNPDYAQEVIRLARQKSAEGGHDDLDTLADRLEWAMGMPEPQPERPLVQRMSDAVRAHGARGPGVNAAPPASAGARPGLPVGDSRAGTDGAPRYVKGLR